MQLLWFEWWKNLKVYLQVNLGSGSRDGGEDREMRGNEKMGRGNYFGTGNGGDWGGVLLNIFKDSHQKIKKQRSGYPAPPLAHQSCLKY